jgi:hypothetical protein
LVPPLPPAIPLPPQPDRRPFIRLIFVNLQMLAWMSMSIHQPSLVVMLHCSL